MRERFGVSGGALLLAAVLAGLVALGPGAARADAVKLTFIGDSKAAMIEYSARAKRLLSRGHDVRRDLRVCRRLVRPSCNYPPEGTPRTALQSIRYYGTRLGRVLVIDVGYNDHSSTYRRELNQVMRAALARGVKGVLWVNLRTVRPDYRKINAIISRARNRWPQLYLSNWNRYSRGHPGWFRPISQGGDGIHLTTAGVVGLVKLVRRGIPRAAAGARTQPAVAAAAVAFDYPAGRDAAAGTTSVAPSVPVADVQEVADSPPVGSNLGGSDTGLPAFLPFAGGAALMLFLVFVTALAARRRFN